MSILRDDPNHWTDIDHAIRCGIAGVSKKDPDVANDKDQWITNPSVLKSNSHSTGVSTTQMKDATPLDRFWDALNCWDALIEIL
jgi:hypothetical protein